MSAKRIVAICSTIFMLNLSADNVIKIPPKSAIPAETTISLNLESQIENLEQNADEIDEYTTKYFKKRVDYNNPFSSEAQDYQDSVLIERTRKAPKMPSIRGESNDKITKDTKSSSDSRKIRQGIAKISSDLDFNVNVPKAKSTQDSHQNPNDSQSIITASLTTPKPFSEPKTYKKVLDSHKPKVVIIIDDIASPKQISDIRVIQDAGLKLTPSIFPIAKSNTKMLDSVAKLDFFMVHLPLEALAYKDELDTISIGDSAESIEQKIAHIKQILPNTRYINNHTGSKFTERKDNMEALINALDLHNISFVDSRTTPNTAIPSIAEAQNRLILHRDIFIDNHLDAHSLATQIKEGVKIAKARGYAILIAHPHKETLNALKVAKNGVLREVDVIYLDELDYLLQKSHISQYAQVLKSP